MFGLPWLARNGQRISAITHHGDSHIDRLPIEDHGICATRQTQIVHAMNHAMRDDVSGTVKLPCERLNVHRARTWDRTVLTSRNVSGKP
ncbi:hypothetical protein BSFA1_59690 [Burkholderia sp. SFA1]|nr:hypothetical protein BSFA1_59690 [Burkholderia sp. SFA1]